MNRRSFLHTILAASVAPMFLPGGGRLWKATLAPPINPEWLAASYETSFLFDPIAYVGMVSWVRHQHWNNPRVVLHNQTPA